METLYGVLEYMEQYGMIFLVVIVYLEYLNLPGLPAGIIMPAAGIMVARSDMNFILALGLSVLAGLLGSYTLYGLGYFLGRPIKEKLYNKYKKLRPSFDKAQGYVERYGNKGVFVSRMIPVARTLISLVAGIAQMKLGPFTLYSTIGITVWNLGFILAGYIFAVLGKI